MFPVAQGPEVAAGNRGLGWLHRARRVLGPVLFVVGVVAAVAMYLESGVQHRTGQWLAGLGEFLADLLALAVASTGGCLWLASISGPRGWADGAAATAA